MNTSVYRKCTNTDIYINWNAHAPYTWKIATLKSLVKRALQISSTTISLEVELNHIKDVFCNLNDYPKSLVEEVIKNEQCKHLTEQQNNEEEERHPDDIEEAKPTFTLNLPYAGSEGEKVITKMKKYIKNTVNKGSKTVNVCATYRTRKLSSKFNTKDKTKFEHTHNVVYYAKCPNHRCKSDYGGQTKCRLGKRVSQHRATDRNSHILKHSMRTKHKRVDISDFKVLGKGYKSDFKRRISESLFIKKLKPDLNVHKDSYKLTLFN